MLSHFKDGAFFLFEVEVCIHWYSTLLCYAQILMGVGCCTVVQLYFVFRLRGAKSQSVKPVVPTRYSKNNSV